VVRNDTGEPCSQGTVSAWQTGHCRTGIRLSESEQAYRHESPGVTSMDFATWEPVYETILADFGFSREADERARDLLASLVTGETLAPAALDFGGATVAVAGSGPSLHDEVARVRRADVVVAASDAAHILRTAGVSVDCMVTDLDEEGAVAQELTHEGTPVAVHAHGDNEPACRERVPALAHDAVLPTTQAAPAGPVHNPGGFTDGDRAAFLADACGAAQLVFVGWDFDDPTVDPWKRRKLDWAERLVRWLEWRRGERFSVLDGRRETIDESVLPV
jgi:uncharacterized Rossmann fold enzyme